MPSNLFRAGQHRPAPDRLDQQLREYLHRRCRLCLNQAVESLQDTIVDLAIVPVQHSGLMTPDRFGCVSDGTNATMGCPEIPFLQGSHETLSGLFFVDFLEVLTDMIGPHGFQVESGHSLYGLLLGFSEVLPVFQKDDCAKKKG